MKILRDTFDTRVIDIDEKEYNVTFESDSGFIFVVQGIHASDLDEAIAAANMAMYNYYFDALLKESDPDTTAEYMCSIYTVLSVERIRK